MSSDHVTELLVRSLELGLSLSAPLLGAGLVVGLAISILQAATQVQESTLNFVPKLAAIAGTLALMGPWALQECSDFLKGILVGIAQMGGGGF